jgi:peptidyl-prolyl cis-trans isomerase D
MALATMRRHRRWLYVFLWIVILGFIVFYIPASWQGVDAGSPGEALSTIGGEKITVAQFQNAYRSQIQMYQGRVSPDMLRRLGIEGQVLQTLEARKLIALEAQRLGLSVGEDAIAQALTTMPQFQENGRFVGTAAIKRWLEYQNMGTAEFEEELRGQLLRDQLEALVTRGLGVSPAEVEQEFRRRTEQAKVEYVQVDSAPFKSQAAVTEDEVKSRFEKARDTYRIPEQRVLAYLLVDEDALRTRATVTDADLEAYYREHTDEFKEEEQACASHILIKVKASPEAKEGHPDGEALQIAQGLLAKVKAGADFAELARKSSEDQGSADRGGDLDCFPRAAMVPEFANAAFSLDSGQTSDLVKTNFGYHIIRLASRREEQVLPLGAVKERIRPMVTAEKTQKVLDEQVGRAQATLRTGSLEDAAKAIGQSVVTSPAFSLAAPPEPLSSPALAARAFALKSTDTDRDGFPVSRGHVFFRVAEVKPARAAELTEVQDKIKAELLEEKALALALGQAEAVRARAEAQGLEKAAAASKLVRKETPALVGRGQALGELGDSAAVEEAAFGLPVGSLSGPVRTARGYVVLRVLERKGFDPEAFASQKAAVSESLLEQKRSQLFQAFLSEARDRYVVERNPEALRRLMGRG